MSELLLIVVHGCHLLCVNVASAGPLVCIGLDWHSRKGDPLALQAARFLAWASCWTLALGVGFGLLLGWLVWEEQFSRVVPLFWNKILFGIAELVFSAVLGLIAAAWLQWGRVETGAQGRSVARWVRSILWGLSGTNLLYHFPVLFAVMTNVSAGYSVAEESVTGAAFRTLMLEQGVLARAAHVVLASFAVTGLALSVWAVCRAGRGPIASHELRVGAWGARLALLVTAFQLPVGLWVIGSLPPIAQRAALGADPIAGLLLATSLLGTFVLLQQLAAAAFAETTRRSLLGSVAMTVLIVILMTGVLQRITE